MSLRTRLLLATIMGTGILLFSPFKAIAQCHPMHRPCWLTCNNPPPIHDAANAIENLRSSPNKHLGWMARTSSLLTTPLGKKLGIRGWRDYCFRVYASGQVIQAADSWDHLFTVDLKISSLSQETAPPHPISCCRYIRAELFPHVWNGINRLPAVGDSYRISGRLEWDADGFLEIHPESAADVRIEF